MTSPGNLTVELLSDATFSSGGGTPGVVDLDVTRTREGLPFVPGKTLHGLLREAWLGMRSVFGDLSEAAAALLGEEGDRDERSILRVGNAHLDERTRAWVRHAVGREHHPLHPEDVLGTLTDVRAQTSRRRETGGAPEQGTLRASRVVLRGTRFHAPLTFLREPTPEELRCLALCALATRHGGLARNRGRGVLRCLLDGDRAGTLARAGIDPDCAPEARSEDDRQEGTA
jgi:hypothetical protein